MKQIITILSLTLLIVSCSHARLKRDVKTLDLKNAEQAVTLFHSSLEGIFGTQPGSGTPILINFGQETFITENFFLGAENSIGILTGADSSAMPWAIVSTFNLGYESHFGASPWMWNARGLLGWAYTQKIASQSMTFGFALGAKMNFAYEVSKGIRIGLDLGYIFAPINKEVNGFITGLGIQFRRVNLFVYD